VNFCENDMKTIWDLPIGLLFKLQKRLFKVSYVLDKSKLLEFQKLILQSNCSRLLAIREVTQLSLNKNIPGIDGKIFLTFSERFELNEHLKLNWNNWKVQSLKEVLIVKDMENSTTIKIPTISDRTWQTLVKFAIQPIHEAMFHPFNYGFRFNIPIYKVQKAITINLSKISYASQKRFVYVDMSNSFCSFNYNYLIKKILAPRSVKLGIFRILEKGFNLEFPNGIITDCTFSALLANILISGIEIIHCCVRYGYYLLFFLKPRHNEKLLLDSLKMFFLTLGLNLYKIKIKIFSSHQGFNFLGWYFKLTTKNKNGLFIFPSYTNYQSFLIRLKRIINNSNFGSLLKVSKMYPVIKNWKIYHKYSNLVGPCYSLFFVKKRTFKIFNSESKQDFYSSKRLLSKCFSLLYSFDRRILNLTFNVNEIQNFGHLIFPSNFNFLHNGLIFGFCIHCGVRIF
jgi:RNA-directed DNA polymerase